MRPPPTRRPAMPPSMTERFSDRHGFRPPASPIKVREAAPRKLRGAIPMLAESPGMHPSDMRRLICPILLIPADADNWSDPTIHSEVDWLMTRAEWFQVYDIAGRSTRNLPTGTRGSPRVRISSNASTPTSTRMASAGNRATARSSTEARRPSRKARTRFPISWKRRGSSAQPKKCAKPWRTSRVARTQTSPAPCNMPWGPSRRRRARSRVNPNRRSESWYPCSICLRPWTRPSPNSGGYASERGRHIREHQVVDHAEAELVVSLAGALCAFLLPRRC